MPRRSRRWTSRYTRRASRSVSRRAFHLEVQDAYSTPDEAGPFALFLAGRPDDLEWHRPWLDLVRDVTASGVAVDRIRAISVPHGDYTRWGLSLAPHNIAAGEDIRWLPRRLVEDSQLPADDFWLLDDHRVMFTVFEPGGRFADGAFTSDATIAAYCRSVRDDLWPIAISHHEYAIDGRPRSATDSVIFDGALD